MSYIFRNKFGMNLRQISLMLAGLVLLVQCVHDPIYPNGGLPDSGDPDRPCDPDTIYFDRDVLPILSTSCAYSGCHDQQTAEEGIRLNSYENIFSGEDDLVVPGSLNDSELWEVIVETDPDKIMPPPPNNPLLPAQREIIRLWIEQGARNLSCGGCDTSDYVFSADILPFIQTQCGTESCHGSNTAGGGFALQNHNDVVGAVVYRNMMESLNYSLLIPPSSMMPPSGKLDDNCIQKIQNWVDNGMPND